METKNESYYKRLLKKKCFKSEKKEKNADVSVNIRQMLVD